MTGFCLTTGDFSLFGGRCPGFFVMMLAVVIGGFFSFSFSLGSSLRYGSITTGLVTIGKILKLGPFAWSGKAELIFWTLRNGDPTLFIYLMQRQALRPLKKLSHRLQWRLRTPYT